MPTTTPRPLYAAQGALEGLPPISLGYVERLRDTSADLLSLRNDLAWPAQIDRPGSATRLALGRDIDCLIEERDELLGALKEAREAADYLRAMLADSGGGSVEFRRRWERAVQIADEAIAKSEGRVMPSTTNLAQAKLDAALAKMWAKGEPNNAPPLTLRTTSPAGNEVDVTWRGGRLSCVRSVWTNRITEARYLTPEERELWASPPLEAAGSDQARAA